MGRFEYTTYVQFSSDVDVDMGWVTGEIVKFNGVLANWFVNVVSVGIETDSVGIPIPV